MPDDVILQTNLTALGEPRRGKVRDIYEVGDALLIVASDRISAFDVVLPNGIPCKGKVLTALSDFWFDYTSEITSNHLITTDVKQMGHGLEEHADVLRGRSMFCRQAQPLPIECVVRGYLAGSGWKSYKKDGTVCGIELPDGLQQCDKLPEPIFTPATKAESGHDENISFEEAAQIVGDDIAEEVRRQSFTLYNTCADYARSQGIILCDTKFEWGHFDGELILIDEIFTPDSSRFWPADHYEPGHDQPSFDKQFVRNWLERADWDKTPPAPELPPDIIQKTSEKYLEALERLTGKTVRDIE
jgi:phosphoribosylaminoimidazole-succinocarboxamide synthase